MKITELKYILKKKEQSIVDEQKKHEVLKSLLHEQELEIEGLKEHIQRTDRGVNIRELMNSKKVKKIRGGRKSSSKTSMPIFESNFPDVLDLESFGEGNSEYTNIEF